MRILPLLFLGLILACSSGEMADADVIIHGGEMASMSGTSSEDEIIVIKDHEIVAMGGSNLLEEWRGDSTLMIDASNSFVMPGFIESHGHFSGLGRSLQNLNFLRSRSWEEIVAMVGEKVETTVLGEWIIGRGWHQEKWVQVPEENIHGYPYHDALSAVSPDNPVLLYHASGHAAFANERAMDVAGVNLETANPSGGEIVRDERGEAIGVFEERAQEIIRRAYEDYVSTISDDVKLEMWYEGIQLAEEECLSKGITSFQDAGSSFTWIDRYRQLAENEELDLRLWVMIRHSAEKMEGHLDTYPWIGLGNQHLTVRGIKSELDGALGSFGAWLLEPYADKTDFLGQNTTHVEEVDRIAQLAFEHGLQLCVHAIGDRANRETLDIFQKYYEQTGSSEELRWRIEHAQHLDPDDIPRFGQLGVIAAMQGIHCTSDAPFVEKRLGRDRARLGAYPWRALLDAGAVISNGTDAPVEDVDPIESFYASVTRKRIDNGFEFFPEQRMTREEALRSYTIDAAYAGFEEDIKGSLEVGKLADITILSRNLLTCTDEEILETEVLYTLVGGEVKYQAGN